MFKNKGGVGKEATKQQGPLFKATESNKNLGLVEMLSSYTALGTAYQDFLQIQETNNYKNTALVK